MRWRWLARWWSRPLRVSGPSMEPGFNDGQVVRMGRLRGSPARGEVVVVCLEPPRWELKRVVGLPGETVRWLGGRVWIDGQPLAEPYARDGAATPGDEPAALGLGHDEYFLLGDNRLHSRDSRRLGAVPRAAMIGRILLDA